MRLRRTARTILALVAAYAVALEAILLAIGGPLAAAGDLASRQICSSVNSNSSGPMPAGHGYDCLAACIACCCGAQGPTGPATAITYAPKPAGKVTVAVDVAAAPGLGAMRAHRSRAPPLG